MKGFLRFAVGGVLALSGLAGWSQTAGQAATIGKMEVKEISVVEIDMTHVKVTVDLSVTPAQSVTMKNLRLCSLSLNGMPVFAEPLNQETVLRKGVPTSLPPVYVNLQFRDLYSVKPISDMIESQKVHIDGELVADIQLNLIEKLAMNTLHPKVAIAINQDVPAEVGGNPVQRSMATGILSAIETGLEAKAIAGKYIPMGKKPAWIQALETQAKQNVLLVESGYSVTAGGQKNAVNLTELGFRVGTGTVVTTAEAREPWKYDAEYMGAANAGTLTMVKNSHDIVLLPAGPGASLGELSHKDFKVTLDGIPVEDRVTETGSGPGTVTVLRRASPSSLVLLKLKTPASAAGLTVAPAAVAAQDSWDQVAVFRQRKDPATGSTYVETITVGAKRDGQGIKLLQPVDSAVFGSPIVTPDGVIGVVQDEEAGALLPLELTSATTVAPK